VIQKLRRALLGAFGRRPTLAAGPPSRNARAKRSDDAGVRIEAARRRLKATIPPPQD
jgi:hypothetical protein